MDQSLIFLFVLLFFIIVRFIVHLLHILHIFHYFSYYFILFVILLYYSKYLCQINKNNFVQIEEFVNKNPYKYFPKELKNKIDNLKMVINQNAQQFDNIIISPIIQTHMNYDDQQDFIYIQQSQNSVEPNLQQLQIGSRLQKRFHHANKWYRIVIIKIIQKQSTENIQMRNQKKEPRRKLSAIQKQLQSQYQIHCRVDSEFVLKYMSMNRVNKQLTFVQQDYLCLLSELQLSNLSLQNRFQLFQSILKGVKDIHDKFICLRSLSPKSIAICIEDGKYVGKIKSMEAAITLINKNDFSYDTRALQLLGKYKLCGFASPQIRKMSRHGIMTDIWSLGSIFNYILYESILNIKEDNKKIKVQLPEKTPYWLRNILQSMLNFQPQFRVLLSSILQVIQSSFKCSDMLERSIPFGKKQLVNKLIKSSNLIL